MLREMGVARGSFAGRYYGRNVKGYYVKRRNGYRERGE